MADHDGDLNQTRRGMDLTHNEGEFVAVAYNGAQLFRYVYFDQSIPQNETPKPYVHPLSTLAGRETTGYRPPAHTWHTGLTITIPSVGDWNFWGGNTYVPEKGYVQLANNGSIQHESWLDLGVDHDELRMSERLAWVAPDGEQMLSEVRHLSSLGVSPERGAYALELEYALTNVTARDLVFGTAATEGLSGMGYWGLHWRGSEESHPGLVFSSDGRETDEQVRGARAPWVAYVCPKTGVHDAATLIFVDRKRPQRFPTQWFVQSTTMASVTASFVFDETYALSPAGALELSHWIIVSDGALDLPAAVTLVDHFESSRGEATR